MLQRAQASKYFKKIDFWLKAKPHLSDEIKEMEAFRKFELSKVDDFVPSTLNKAAFKGQDEAYFEAVFRQVFTEAEQLQIKYSSLNSLQIDEELGQNFLDYYKEQTILLEAVPLHSRTLQKSAKDYDIGFLNSYYGEKVSFYYRFLDFLQKWLILPAIIGVVAGLLNIVFADKINDSPFVSVYSFFVIFWASLFLSFWAREEKRIAIKTRSFSKNFR